MYYEDDMNMRHQMSLLLFHMYKEKNFEKHNHLFSNDDHEGFLLIWSWNTPRLQDVTAIITVPDA